MKYNDIRTHFIRAKKTFLYFDIIYDLKAQRIVYSYCTKENLKITYIEFVYSARMNIQQQNRRCCEFCIVGVMQALRWEYIGGVSTAIERPIWCYFTVSLSRRRSQNGRMRTHTRWHVFEFYGCFDVCSSPIVNIYLRVVSCAGVSELISRIDRAECSATDCWWWWHQE